MIIKTYFLDEALEIPSYINSFLMKAPTAIIDIETTGLNPQFNKVILIGIYYIHEGSCYIKQLFADTPSQEYAILHEFNRQMAAFKNIITYNGEAFDIPFLKKSFTRNGLECKLEELNHIDVLKHLKKYKDLFKLRNLKLKSLEEHLNIYRKDTISGKESVDYYKEFQLNKSERIMNKILLHNYDDLYYLGKALHVFNSLPPYLWKKYERKVNYLDIDFIFEYLPYHISIKGNGLIIQGFSSGSEGIPDVSHYCNEYSFLWSPQAGGFKISIPLALLKLKDGRRLHYIDLLEYDSIIKSIHKFDKPLSLYQGHYLIINNTNIEDLIYISTILVDYALEKLQSIYNEDKGEATL